MESRKKNILIVNLEGKISGAERSLLILTEGIKKQSNIKIAIACPKPSCLYTKLEKQKIPIYGITAPPIRLIFKIFLVFYILKVNIQILLITLKIKPEIIHANSTKATLATVASSLFTKTRIIWHIRDLPKKGLILAICDRISEKTISVSKYIKDELPSDIGHAKTSVIYNGADVKQSNYIKKNYDQQLIFANIGQFVPWKNQLLFIEAGEKYLSKNKNAQFWIIGNDVFGRNNKYKTLVEQKVQNSLFKDSFRLISWQDDLTFIWKKISCLIHTASTEPFGRVIIEAMAHKVPVIAADCGGPAEIIADGKTGLLYEANNIDKLLSAMGKFASNYELKKDLTQNAYKSVCENFSSKNYTKEILNIYKKLFAA